MQWTDAHKEALFKLRRLKVPYVDCAKQMSERWAEEFSVESLQALYRDMLLTRWVSKRKSRETRPRHPFAGEDPAVERQRLRQANVYHLIDLKRAGHSPTQTEYQITPEGKGVRYPTVARSSYLGSSAASCAEEV